MAVATKMNGVASNGLSLDMESLAKSLPHVDVETGLKNRVVRRDPISGLGDLPKEHCAFGRSKTPTLNRRAYTPTLISWDVDSTTAPLNLMVKPQNGHVMRNPIALLGELGKEVDNLRTTPRPRTGTPREPQRDPISGRGDFGTREWDPVWKYNGKTRKNATNERTSNPLTGENLKSFTVTVEEKCRNGLSPRVQKGRNVLTGENCTSFDISSEIKDQGSSRRKEASVTRNTLTGDNCQTYDINVETRKMISRSQILKVNPLNGENVNTYNVSSEERPRSARPYVYTNTVTGENRPSYKITPIERSVQPRTGYVSSNPLSGENTQTYTYRLGEKKNIVRQRDMSSPITGFGSRGISYTVSVEERRGQQNMNSGSVINGHGATVNGDGVSNNRNRTGVRNILTGENCESYLVCQEMRSEKRPLSAMTKVNGSAHTTVNGGITNGKKA